MPASPMKNLSEYVTYEDFLKMEKAAMEFDETARLKSVRKGSYHLLIRLLFFTGARIAEVVGAPGGPVTKCMHPQFDLRKGRCPKWIQVRNDSACIDIDCKHFRTHYLKPHHGIRVKDIVFKDRLIAIYGKHTNSKELKPRTVVIDEDTLKLIEEHITKYDLQPNDKIVNTVEYGAKAFIKRTGKKVGLPWISAHKFRHGHAIYCVQKGMDIRTLQQQLGHASLDVTAVYLQFATGDRKKSYDKVFGNKADFIKTQCPSCGFTYRLKKNLDIELEERLETIFST
ncbi:MAG: site-specific integrase [Methanolobus sp.]